MPPKRRPPAATPTQEKKARPSKLAKENNISAPEELEIKEAFSLFSIPDPSSKAEVIPTPDIRRALIALGTPAASTAELRELTETVDPTAEGFVSYEHFVAVAALKLQSRSDESQREEVETAFRLFTRGDGQGRITMADLRRVARELKEDVSDQVLRDMIMEANGGSGVIKGVGVGEFEGVMKRAGVFS
ncbi:MAG: hypothetical protein FRX48_07691 [Lasallia pustulata]|uniref:EF-hand domain pair n=1 Tax=Lasallia pustulata TaxID=136370 RepID=A0A1W5D130_9LECA|nr:MAG: hypothetical protein FRX48_07691 [Lasallia pustulata]SLM36720.1 EF-hand domain pair [Lasallia pustulata]